MQAEIISVGSELLSPDRSDTNSLWITGQLNRFGIEVRRKVIWGDEVDGLAQEIATALERSPLVFTTGGLGPTEDDVTREAVARALGVALEERPELVTELEAKFARLGRKMTPNNLRQCQAPQGSQSLPNPLGTAPGLTATRGDSRIFVLPGPPREMQPMFTAQIEPELAKIAGDRRIDRLILRVIGLGESALDALIAPIYNSIANPRVGLLFSALDVEVHLTASGSSLIECQQLNRELAEQFREVLGDHVYAEGARSLADVVCSALLERGRKVFILDQATHGLVAQRILDCERGQDILVGACIGAASSWGIGSDTVAADGWLHLFQDTSGAYVTELRWSDGEIHNAHVKFPGEGETRRSRAAQGALDLMRRSMLA